MKNGIISIDIFGKSINLKMEGREEYKTLVGGLLTILMMILMVVVTVFFGLDLIERKNPSYYFQILQGEGYPISIINNTNFFIAGRVTGTGSRPVLDPRFFDVRFEYY